MSVDNNVLDKEIADLLQTNPAIVDLSNRGITGEHVKMIVEHQKQNPTIAELDLSNNNIGAEGYNALAGFVRESKVLTRLTADNNFKKSYENGKIIYQSSDEPSYVVKAVDNLKNALLKNPNILVAGMDYLTIDNHLFTEGKTYGNLGTDVYGKCDANIEKARECIANIENMSNNVEHYIEIKNRMAAISAIVDGKIKSYDCVDKWNFTDERKNKFKENLAKIKEQAAEKGVFIEIPEKLQLKPSVAVESQVTALTNHPEQLNAVGG